MKRLLPDCCRPVFLTPEEEARVPSFELHGPEVPQRLSVVLGKKWGPRVKLGVSFLENVSAAFRDKVLSYANQWGAAAGGGNVEFAWSQSQGEVRVTTEAEGYWSYLGKDVLGVAASRPTLCLERFSLETPESEWSRVVPHEFGHSLGFPHEHLRAELVGRIDPAKALAYFRANQGWDAATTTSQVLTPISAASILGTPEADATSVMCYMLPGAIMKDGRPIAGGVGINDRDRAFVRTVYPLDAAVLPPTPAGPTVVLANLKITLDAAGKVVKVELAA